MVIVHLAEHAVGISEATGPLDRDAYVDVSDPPNCECAAILCLARNMRFVVDRV